MSPQNHMNKRKQAILNHFRRMFMSIGNKLIYLLIKKKKSPNKILSKIASKKEYGISISAS